jgi:EEF1A lysine methyltransferase 1
VAEFLISEQIDESFGAKDKNFVYFDFNKWDELDESLWGYFDMVIIDPPFITREVWEKYALCAKKLLKENGMWFLSTIDENEEMIKELTGATRA